MCHRSPIFWVLLWSMSPPQFSLRKPLYSLKNMHTIQTICIPYWGISIPRIYTPSQILTVIYCLVYHAYRAYQHTEHTSIPEIEGLYQVYFIRMKIIPSNIPAVFDCSVCIAYRAYQHNSNLNIISCNIDMKI